MVGIYISEIDFSIVENKLSETNEINSGFYLCERSFFQITDSSYIAYAIIYDLYSLDSDLAELARFFVPRKYRDRGFGKLAAISLMDHLFKIKPKILIDPIHDSVEFWCKVSGQFKNGVNFESIDGTKCIWHKI